LLHDHSKEGVQRMISVVGGKLTTAAALARECARKLGIKADEPTALTTAVRTQLDGGLDDLIGELMGVPGLSESAAESIAEWHGSGTMSIVQLARSNPLMRASLCPHTEHIVAEAMEAFQEEYAVTLGDVLLRRVPVALGACWSKECTELAAARIAAAKGWSDAEMKAQLGNFEVERSTFLAPSISDGGTSR
jgi:glycerol-3-phosphate dehydrogenase